MTLLMAADLMLDELDSLQDSPIAEELAVEHETGIFLFTSVN